ncbi:MAG: glycosyltransferase family 2 protein [Alphaproteobacteria bacterium]|nr:glycosyltransferase family 2 protein [Alphaproteobacteria bacterium]MDE2337476.1 glycosyltransferase family 2 protein [Alphaproteobacteria bacterium]
MHKSAAHHNDAPDIIAVIPCLNEERHIERVVRNIIGNFSSPSFLLVIADGGSTDRTPPIARKLAVEFPNVIYLHNPKRLQSAAVNLAVEIYGRSARLLLRLDCHADYPPDYCQTLVAEQKDTGAGAVVVSMHTAGETVFQRAAAAAQNSILGNGGAAHRRAVGTGKWVDHGHHALIRLDIFRAVGGYDENFSHNEDAELDIRLCRAGHKIWLTGKTALTYYPRVKPSLLFRQYFHFGHGRARTVVKHRTIPRLRQMAPLAVAPALALAPLSFFTWTAALPAVLWMSVCLAYGLALGIRARRAEIVLSGPAAMLMHLGWSSGFMRGLFDTLRGAP